MRFDFFYKYTQIYQKKPQFLLNPRFFERNRELHLGLDWVLFALIKLEGFWPPNTSYIMKCWFVGRKRRFGQKKGLFVTLISTFEFARSIRKSRAVSAFFVIWFCQVDWAIQYFFSLNFSLRKVPNCTCVSILACMFLVNNFANINLYFINIDLIFLNLNI